MLLLLPPSETKRDGGLAGSRLDLAALSFPALTSRRRRVSRVIRRLAADEAASISALKLGRSQHGEVARNRTVLISPTLAAIDRYTGVLYDALDAGTLSGCARRFAGEHLVVHSAMLGLVGGLDPIPAYRLSATSRLPGVSLKATWQDAIASVLEKTAGLVLDLRSEAYVGLGRAPDRPDSRYLRVVTARPEGASRRLNHFNKQTKGCFVRGLLDAGVEFASVDELLAWASVSGWALAAGASGELELQVRAAGDRPPIER